ncbi:PAAR domain-containing protein [Pseudomonas fluorescens]|uniref:PAAR domain-containing protein n=1 Tax=Pseudomonas fluorescens TaxID=294 RepID=UPI000349711E|nr:PAAR domain-containing protein [Pseudomonas fluorescens]
MNRGYYIGLGDETTCGGKVLDGDASFSLDGLLHAREGDRVTCGKDGKTYRIIGGITHMISGGRLMAGTLDSQSGCPCNARLLPSVFTASYMNENPPQRASRAAQPAPQSATYASATPGHSTFGPSSYLPLGASTHLEPQEPGFYVVPKSVSREALEATLFPAPDPQVMRKFRALNPHRDVVKAGSLIVLSDPNNLQCTREEALLMETATWVNEVLEPLSVDEADFMARHRAEIETFLTQGSTAIGVGTAIFARNLQDVNNLLRDIEALHQRSFLRDGHLRSPDFFAERQQLLARLDTHLTTMTRKGIGLPDHPNLKSALGISSRSLVHRWTKAGSAGQIPGYSTHIAGVSRAAKIVKYGGWVGTAIGGGASYMKVQDVCTAGNVEACEKVKFTESGSFAGGVIGGAVVGSILTGSTAGAICLALGVPTAGAGTLVCGLVVVGVGSLAAGAAIGKVGEQVGEIIYEGTQ